MNWRHLDRPLRPFVVALVAVVVALGSGACTVPVPRASSPSDYDRKAGHTAEVVASATETARVALDGPA